MRAHEFLSEVFNSQPYPLKQEPDPSRYEQHLSAVTDDGRPIDIYLNYHWPVDKNSRYIGVAFDVDRTQKVTGKGDALRILNTVVSAVTAEVNQLKPPYIALLADPEHYNIYRALTKRFGGEYQLLPTDQIPDMFKNQLTHEDPGSLFILKRKDAVTEDIIAADSNPDLRTMLAAVREEMEAVDDASMDSREGDANYAGLSRDYSALLAIENVIKNNLKAIKNNVMDNNIFMYDYDGDIDEIAAVHVEMQGSVAHVKWLGSYNSRGGELYRAAMQEARRRGATSVEVEAKWNSDGFYRKMGLDTTQPGEYNPFTDSQLNKMAGPLEEETLEELTGIKGIVNKLPKPRDSRFDPLGIDWHTVLNDHGFKSLGYGSFGVVWENPKLPYVLKVFSSKDSAYIDWISVARQNKNNPHMPRFVSARLLKITPEVLAIRMEKLFPVINQEKNVVFESDLLLQERYNPSEQVKSVGFDTDQRNLRYYCQTHPTWLPALDIVKNFSNNSGYRLDFHNKNVMMRDADTLVITDPVYSREDLAGR